MKKGKLLNSRISSVISEMGHTDMLVIADAGLPVPEGSERIDLAVTAGVPDFMTVLNTVLSELQVEKYTLALEIKQKNAHMEKSIVKALESADSSEYVSHEDFKELTKKAKAVIRTGECSPYANVILYSGVVF
ncbi:RbsD or FucU transport [Denitrovibrio acetiphilus DSM 12809]|uniref:D-ribose pyranase n=1 Tax=Denitrovibrio acetiphilus (strain DSM 12809 / NBRC 114555 / N2460) TaxID=522772 RepID=D4H243_DENA2|nr:D-ribose pyranase [Denitrovibrio acetiphilus]ADD67020.1 RbsD or FucU transport [Denitrovibrio acetiphilus DSM 12809]